MKLVRLMMLAALLPASHALVMSSDPPAAVANDNRIPAGSCADGVCLVALDVRMARWYPEEDGGPFVDVPAIGEVGQPAAIPGPLLRAPEGTRFEVTVTNRLPDSTITVHGLTSRPADRPHGLTLAPGATGRVSFQAGAPGTYLYWVRLGAYPDTSESEFEQLAGGLVVDSVGSAPDDRVFVINIYSTPGEGGADVMAINGKSFPFTETLTMPVGDTVHWRWVNASRRNHPMHLHGFYFRLDSHGSALADTVFPPPQRRLAVTETLQQRETLALTWAPEREGNWLFHCHLSFHTSVNRRMPRPAADGHETHGGPSHMAGLVIGITVPPDGSVPEPVARRERLFVQQRPGRGPAPVDMGYVLQRGAEPAPDSVELPGSPLFLTRGELTAVTVVNRTEHETGVHWHGLELESYSDGVVGWSGTGSRVAPMIMPGDSFTARLTLPRAGTFIYHTHVDDVEQLSAGLYAPLIVLEPGETFDPRRDHIFTLGWHGGLRMPAPDGDSTVPRLPTVLNGDSAPAPMVLAAGLEHRFRFINIGPAFAPPFSLWRDSTQMTWRFVAKDGADLPLAQARAGPAITRVWMGETADYVWNPPRAGTYELRLGNPAQPIHVQQLIVRE